MDINVRARNIEELANHFGMIKSEANRILRICGGNYDTAIVYQTNRLDDTMTASQRAEAMQDHLAGKGTK